MTTRIETEDVVALCARLREAAHRTGNVDYFDAADTIERLREENARRGEALKPFAAIGDNFTIPGGWSDTDKIELMDGFRVLDKVPVAAFRNARAALTPSADDDK